MICHGLYGTLQHYLNGEVGVVISYRDIGKGIYLEVRFEKMSLQSEWIQQNRLHIAYELPSIDGKVLKCKGKKCIMAGKASIAMKWMFLLAVTGEE